MGQVQKLMQEEFDKMCQTDNLFRSSIDGDQIWEIYLNHFNKNDDPVFRDPNSSVHNCNYCNNFIRRYGNIVAINADGSLMSIFDCYQKLDENDEYFESFYHMAEIIKSHHIQNVFVETYNMLTTLKYEDDLKNDLHYYRLGVSKNVKRYTKEEAKKFGVVKPNELRIFNHMSVLIPSGLISKSNSSVEHIQSIQRNKKEVLQRGLNELPLDTLQLVRDLIKQGSLLNGDSYLHDLEKFIDEKSKYELCKDSKTIDNYLWLRAVNTKERICKFKNTIIGVLCTELAEGEELNKACQNWNKRVDPVNYMKAKSPITKKQIEEAQKFVEENGYEESFDRRCATLDDIKINEILHSNMNVDKPKSVSVFDNVKATSSQHKRNEFEGIEEVQIDKFMKDILPSCTSIEVFLKNSHEKNFVTLTTANNPDSKRIFKWDNNYSWTYNGNLAGKSMIKEAVKTQGGNVEGVLRASMIWNESGTDQSDLDIWCRQPDGIDIGYSREFRADRGNNKTSMSGQLDLDNTNPGTKIGVENIYFSELSEMKDGMYTFWVNQYANRNSQGFKFEIEFDGQIYSYKHNAPIRFGDVKVAEVTLKNGEFSITHYIPENSVSSKEVYNLETNKFHKVNLLCLSPNYWGDNNVGNKHYFFMLEGCKTLDKLRSFHNENLINELLDHRKVMEVLGNSNSIQPTDKQLSGLGFNATVRDELIVKLSGNFKRTIKLKF